MPSQVAKRRFTASTGEISTAGSICSAARPSYSQAAWCERCSSGRRSWEERPRTDGNSAEKRAAFPSNKGPPVVSCEFINMVCTFDVHARSSPPVSGFAAASDIDQGGCSAPSHIGCSNPHVGLIALYLGLVSSDRFARHGRETGQRRLRQSPLDA